MNEITGSFGLMRVSLGNAFALEHISPGKTKTVACKCHSKLKTWVLSSHPERGGEGETKAGSNETQNRTA